MIEFGGVTIDTSQITYVTYEKDGHTYTITKDAKSSPKVEGFGRKGVPITEGKVCKGGQNEPYSDGPRPPAPGGSGRLIE